MSYSSRGECISVGVKAHVMYGRLLTADDYMRLLSSDTVAEMVKKLRTTSYGERLEGLPSDPHRMDVEALIKADLIREALSIFSHLSAPRSQLFRAWVRRYEAQNLKNIFRGIASGSLDRETMRKRLVVLRSSSVDYDALLGASNFEDAEKALAGSKYAKVIAEPIRKLIGGEEKMLFSLEMAIDGQIELTISRALKKIGRKEMQHLFPIFGARVDLYNLYMMYRAAAFYKMPPEEALSRLLPVRYRVGLEFLLVALRAESPAAALEMIKSQYPNYARILTDSGDAEDAEIMLERNISRYIYLEARRVFASGPPGFHTAMGYFIMKEAEAADIIRIVECVRYGYDRRHALRYLIMPQTAGGER